MRRISFMLTKEQIRARTKTVTRRLGWEFAKAGMLLLPVEKCMGLKAGESMVPLCGPIQLVSTRFEPLQRLIDEPEYGTEESRLEGFPGWTGEQFVEFYCKQPGAYPQRSVNRLEFEYTD